MLGWLFGPAEAKFREKVEKSIDEAPWFQGFLHSIADIFETIARPFVNVIRQWLDPNGYAADWALTEHATPSSFSNALSELASPLQRLGMDQGAREKIGEDIGHTLGNIAAGVTLTEEGIKEASDKAYKVAETTIRDSLQGRSFSNQKEAQTLIKEFASSVRTGFKYYLKGARNARDKADATPESIKEAIKNMNISFPTFEENSRGELAISQLQTTQRRVEVESTQAQAAGPQLLEDMRDDGVDVGDEHEVFVSGLVDARGITTNGIGDLMQHINKEDWDKIVADFPDATKLQFDSVRSFITVQKADGSTHTFPPTSTPVARVRGEESRTRAS